jgi:hypothetical protein
MKFSLKKQFMYTEKKFNLIEKSFNHSIPAIFLK